MHFYWLREIAIYDYKVIFDVCYTDSAQGHHKHNENVDHVLTFNT